MKSHSHQVFSLGTILIATIAFCLLVEWSPAAGKTAKVQAQSNSFQAGHIIDDNIFTNSNALTAAQIQTFLNDMVGSCDTNGSQSITYHYNAGNGQVNNGADPLVTTSRATYGQRYDSANGTNVAAAPYVCINNYLENTQIANQLAKPRGYGIGR